MQTTLTRMQIGVRSAGRALLPVLWVIGGLLAEGGIKTWRDLLSPVNIGIVLSGLGVKGALAAKTAKDVTVSS